VVAPAWRAAVTVLVLLGALGGPAAWVSAQTLSIDAVGDAVKIRASGFSFLKGTPVARLKDGRSVRVEIAAMVLPGPGKEPAATTRRIFALSYDLWEERFAVTAVGARSQSVSHLALAAAEAWCLEQLAIPLNALGALGRPPGDVPFWVRVEYRILDADAPSTPPDSGYTLQALIDLLSRRRTSASTSPEQAESATRALEGGPFKTPRGSSSPR
jgi:hypothetical protein